jgi:hypothetical protein
MGIVLPGLFMKKIIGCLLTVLVSATVVSCQRANLNDFTLPENDNFISSTSLFNPVTIKVLTDNKAQLSDINSGILVTTLSGGELDQENTHKVSITLTGKNATNGIKNINLNRPSQNIRHKDRHGKTIRDFLQEHSQANNAFITGSFVKRKRNMAMTEGVSATKTLSEGAERTFKLRDDDKNTVKDRPSVLKKVTKTAYFWVSNAEADEIDDALLDDAASYWESTAFPVITNKFGAPPLPPNDVDNDKRINIFIDALSPKSDGLYGYFSATDVAPDKDEEATSNHADMLYLNSWLFKKAEAEGHYAKSTLIHEFQHLVNYNAKVTQRLAKGLKPVDEQRWLDEGLSTYAEQLGGFGLPYKDPFFVDYLTTFFDDPAKFSIVTEKDDLNYGAEYLFTVYLVEQYGLDTIKKLVNSDKSGIANVEAVTKVNFKNTFTNWATALLLSGSGKNPKFDFTSVDLHKKYGDKVLDGINLNKIIGQFPSQSNLDMNSWAINYIKLENINNQNLNLNIKLNGNISLGSSLIKLD